MEKTESNRRDNASFTPFMLHSQGQTSNFVSQLLPNNEAQPRLPQSNLSCHKPPTAFKFCQNKNIEYEKCMEGKIVMTNRGHSDKVRCGRESENMVCGEPVT